MKKCLALMMILVLALGLAACFGGGAETTVPTTTAPTEQTTIPTTQPTEPPVKTMVGGINLAGMNVDEATAALTDAAASYKLDLTVNGTKLVVSAEEMGLALDRDALAVFVAAVAEDSESDTTVFTYDRAALTALLGDKLNTEPRNATLSYDASRMRFVASEDAMGVKYDVEAVADALSDAICALNPTAEIEVSVSETAPEITADGEKMTAALKKANGYLGVSLTYTFTPDGGSTAKESIGASVASGFVSISDSLEVSVSKSSIESWADNMASRHNGGDTKGKFVTSGGSTLNYTVTYTGQRVNKTALADDVYKCITEGITGTRTAPYYAKSTKPYGGSYVEIDLSSQTLWLYKDGERIVKTSLVSGCVAKEYCTPTGIYSIYAKQTDRYLTGPDYRSYVEYWMPFYGGYGLHDASWRWSFGGTIYHYNGSHGCVNLPSSAAEKIFNNVSVGTKVILYGGKTEVPDLEQSLSGTASYTVKSDAAPFKLDVKAKYEGAELTYASSDANVVAVSADGTVTVKGAGTAAITVTAAPFDYYTGAELKVTVNVEAAETEPTEPEETTEPTEPEETTKPTEPEETTKPTEPEETTKPTEPEETTKPTEPEETTAPTEPAETTKPTEPVETKPTEPAETTKPTEPVETTKPTEPAETTKPTEPAETTKPTEPAETTKPTEPAETTKPTEPAETTKPTEPAETTKPTEPVETTKPAEPEESTESTE